MAKVERFHPFGAEFDLAEGTMREPDNVVVRRASDMRGYYADNEALEALVRGSEDPIHYRVYELSIPEEKGHLRVVVSELLPGKVAGEYFMTKGHYHEVPETAEVYLCLRGGGYMMMKSADGRCVEEPMEPGRMVYVPPHWAHRSINVSDEPLVSFCVYPGEAGHNYGDIVTEGFPHRIFAGDTKPVIFSANEH